MKPLATLMKPLRLGQPRHGRRRPRRTSSARTSVAVPAAAVIGESLLCLSLAQAIVDKFGGDSMAELAPRVQAWRASQPTAGAP